MAKIFNQYNFFIVNNWIFSIEDWIFKGLWHWIVNSENLRNFINYIKMTSRSDTTNFQFSIFNPFLFRFVRVRASENNESFKIVPDGVIFFQGPYLLSDSLRKNKKKKPAMISTPEKLMPQEK